MSTYISTSEVKRLFSVGKTVLTRLREENQLLEGLHFVRVPGGKKLLWNYELVNDYFANGGGLAHQRGIENYSQSLLSNQPKKAGRKKQSDH